jgi:hypothetical protein
MSELNSDAPLLQLTKAHAEQLLIAKYLYRQAVGVLDRSIPFSTGLAVSLSQDAAELLIWTIARDVDASNRERATWEEVWAAIPKGERNARQVRLPLHNFMSDLNRARVAFKHNGQLPTYEHALRLVGYAEEFLREGVERYYGIGWDALSLANLLTNHRIADEVRAVERLRDSDFAECVTQSAVVERHIHKELEAIMPASARHQTSHESALMCHMIGVPLSDYLRFYYLVPIVHEAPSGSVQCVVRPTMLGYTYSAEDAAFCANYITEFALRVDGLVRAVTA